MIEWHLEKSRDPDRRSYLEAALATCSDVLKRKPDDAPLHHRKGNLLLQAGRLDEAEAAQRQAIALDDRPHWFHDALATVLERMARTEEAIGALDQALQRGPEIARLHHRKGNLLLKAGRLDDAEAAQRQAIALDDSPHWFHEALATVLERAARAEEAVEAIDQALQRAPEIARLHHRKGMLQARAGRLDEADGAHRQAAVLYRRSFVMDQSPIAAAGSSTHLMRTRELCRFLALTAARRWSGDVEKLCRDGSVHDDREWPLGRRRPIRVAVPLDSSLMYAANPALSVMIPVYGIHNEEWLIQSVESIISQRYSTYSSEIVIVDDACGAHTAKKVAETYNVRYVQNDQNIGIVANHNQCLNLASGEFVHFLHQDDCVRPGFYEKTIGPLVEDHALVAAYANQRLVDQDGREIRRQTLERTVPGRLRNWPGKLAQRQAVEFSSIVVRRSAYLAVGGFSPSLAYAFDWDMWSRIASLGPVWYEPRCLADIRVHRHSATHRIAPLDRLVDEMRCVFHTTATLPEAERLATARVALIHLLPKYWTMVLAGTATAMPPEIRRLSDFLTEGLADAEDGAMLVAHLRELRKDAS